LLAREDLRQIAQRITARFHLDPLSREETYAYVRHRLRVAGATTDIFTHAALRELYRVSGGVPRVINIVSDRALLGAYTQELHLVPGALVRRAGGEVFGHELLPAWLPAAAAAAALAVLGGSAFLLWRHASGLAHFSLGRRAPAAAAAPTVKPATPSPAVAAPVAVPAPAPAPAPSVPPTLVQLLAANHDSTDSDTAFKQLFGLWNATYVPGKTDGCSQALAQGLHCLLQRGSFAQLRLLNRPAILMLSDETGAPFQVVLRGLHDDNAQLQIGAQTATVGVAELARYWFGDFVLLWHPASNDVRDLSQGMHGGLVRRLREQLERWRGTDPGAVSDQFDGDLMQLVEQFQRASRLTVDGVAGIETQVALDAALAPPDSPLLTRGG
jgi:general secretion pathway protein A